jgi:hypothetical protein
MPEDFVSLEDTIADAVNDAQIGDEPAIEGATEEAAVDETPVESASSDESEAATEPDTHTEETQEVASPAVKAQDTTMQDEFEKLAGVSATGFGGRENRIPYSRVKKITEKAVGELAEAALGRKLGQGEKALDVVKAHVAQIPELTTKVADYETRLNTVGEFEGVMANDPQRFLGMLAKIPAYQEFFQFVNHAYDHFSKTPGATADQSQAQATPTEAAAQSISDMPQPDEALPDGSRVYSIEGLQKVLDWKAQQIEARISKQFEGKYTELQKQYEPIANDWRTQQRLAAAKPFVEKKLAEAAQWPLFTEHEEAILKVLQADPKISLEGAYQKVVFPKLLAERSSMKQGVIKEMQKAPTSTSLPSRSATKPVAAKAGPRTLEDVIREQIETLK